MKTDLQALVSSSTPSFCADRLIPFYEQRIEPYVVARKHQPRGTVDLSRVTGTTHPRYSDSSWLELLGNPPGSSESRLERCRDNLLSLQRDPDYYLRSDQKEYWSFYLVAGNYFVSEGNHRTVIGRFLLACNDLPQVVSGVAVTELTIRDLTMERLSLEELSEILVPNPSFHRTCAKSRAGR